MNRPLRNRLPVLALLIAGIACAGAACAQPGWRSGPGSGWGSGGGPGWGRGPGSGYYGMGPGMMGPGGMGPGMMGPGWGRGMPGFGDFDSDSDGRVSRSEFDAARGERRSQRSAQGYPMRGAANAPSFSDLDANGDASISPDEMRNFHYNRRRSWSGWR